ncbi:hypothetical protein P9246_10855 [Aeribacillus pallidus]|uniref:hypothetical protein n=1 Tax=Aeribacillus composti TaxID=1868734 RepID=UPI002E22C2F5|nr:hypothetical protein [Aeribacillus composti]MED4487240.1 hypothetical protein [Aeribacillus pallidus]
MSTSSSVNQDLYDIIEEILAKSKRSLIYSNSNHLTTESATERKENVNNRSLKDLLKAKENLNTIKEKLSNDPIKYRKELDRISRIESKLEVSIEKAEKREILVALQALKKDPKRNLLKLLESKNKLDQLKSKLEENPRKYRVQLKRIEILENKFNQMIDSAKRHSIRRAIMYIQKNPKRFREELNRFNEIEEKLKKGLENIQDKENAREKNKDKEKAKTKEKDLDLIR